MSDWLNAFLWTCALEQPVYVLFLRGRFKSWWGPCVLSLAVNALSHPLLWAACLNLPEGEVPFEMTVIGAEALLVWLCLLRAHGWRKALLPALGAAAAANLLSWLAGPAILRLVG